MNLKNLAMWGIIVFLTIGLYNMFKNPQSNMSSKNQINFSEFLSEVDNGRVIQVEIKGNNIEGVAEDWVLYGKGTITSVSYTHLTLPTR